MKNKLVLLLGLFIAAPAHAFTYLNWGMALDYPGGGSYSDVQTYSLGRQESINKTFDLFAEMGGWKDPGHYDGADPGVFFASGLALNLHLHEHYAQYSLGPALIYPPDTLLGSPFQVYHKLSFGWNEPGTDKRIGIGIKHFSNAGLFPGKNYGRNFVFLEIAL